MNAATKLKCQALRNEVVSLGFTADQFNKMVRVAFGWADCHGSWRDASLAVRNTCAYWKTPAELRASGSHLGRCI